MEMLIGFVCLHKTFVSSGQMHSLHLSFLTGEAWQEIMMSCISKDTVECEEIMNEDGLTISAGGNNTMGGSTSCGNDIAFPYFISFYVLCSFLVS